MENLEIKRLTFKKIARARARVREQDTTILRPILFCISVLFLFID